MIWEIGGIGFSNKGAELMLAAIVSRKREYWPGIELAASPHAGSYERRAHYGLLQLFQVQTAGRMGWLVDRLMHRGYRQPYGLVREQEIRGVLDASGYALGDPWRLEWITSRANRYERLRRQGKRIILLPQAIGPLEIAAVRVATGRVIESANIVFTRDPESYDAALSVCSKPEKIFVAPDFTCLIEGHCPFNLEPHAGRVAIVPNSKMLRSESTDSAFSYIEFLVRAVEEVARSGMIPLIVLHELEQDIDLAARIIESARCEVDRVLEPDPVCLKGIIGTCDLVVSSRYHASVNALSQGVPCVGTSWAHKYRYLFEDYQVGDLLIDQSGSVQDGVELVRSMLDPLWRDEVRAKLLSAARRQKQLAEDMWSRVESTWYQDDLLVDRMMLQ